MAMKEVYPSWASAAFSVVLLILVGFLVWISGGNTLETYVTELILFFVALWMVLAAAGKFPLYRLR